MSDDQTPLLDGSATVVTVSSQAEFAAACWTLAKSGGGTIRLEAGAGYSLQMSDYLDQSEDAPLTITSADPSDPAVLTHVNLRDRENITFEGVKFEAAKGQIPGLATMLRISDCENIKIVNCEMSSNAEGVFGVEGAHTAGLNLAVVRGSEGVVFSGNRATGFLQGLTLMDSHDGTVTGNEFSGFQGDGIRIAGVSGLLVEGNYLHDFAGAVYEANHPDFIQIWGTNIKVNNENITIRENILDTGAGQAYQGIFGRNEDAAKNGFLYKNLLVEHNVIHSSFWSGITLADTLGAVVRNNTVLNNPDSYLTAADGSTTTGTMSSWIKVTGEGSVVENNIAHNTWGVAGNAVLGTAQTGDGSDVYSHFVNIEAGGSGDLRDLMLKPDSALNGAAGSRLTWWSDTPERLTAVADIDIDRQDKSLAHLDASLSHGPEGEAGADSFLWTFDDGTSLSGRSVSHDFGAAGSHGYTLQVTAADGSSDTIHRTVVIEDTVTLDLEIGDGGLHDSSSHATSVTASDTVSLGDGWATIGDQARLTLSRSESKLFNLTNLNYEMTLEPEPGASGFFLHQFGTLGASVGDEGRVTFYVATDDGLFRVITEDPVFADGAAHHLNLVFSDAAGTIAIYVDGALAAEAEASGITAPAKYWGLTFGHSWNDGLDTQISNVRLSTEAPAAAEIAEHYAELRAEALERDAPPVILQLDFDHGSVIDASDQGVTFADVPSESFTDHGAGRALRIESGDHLSVDKGFDHFYARDSFEFSLELRSDATTGLNVFGVHHSLSLEVRDDDARFWMKTDQGTFIVRSEGDVLADHDWHDVTVSYDSQSGTLSLSVDGAVVQEVAASGTTGALEYHAFKFGTQWGSQGFAGEIDNFTMREAPHDHGAGLHLELG